jgi:hypothetical protein
MANLEGKRLPLLSQVGVEEASPFGGIGRDVRWIRSLNLVFVADLPLSLMGDLITLPKTLHKRPHVSQPSQSTNRTEPLAESPQRSELPNGGLVR